jgi:hypothetical protein
MFCSVASPDALELPILDRAKIIAKIETTNAALDLNAFSPGSGVSISMLLTFLSLLRNQHLNIIFYILTITIF